tara:strand:- start:788 stop:1570 length:783 start_codon:yes stop_codon:yes gene_type:complete
MLTFNLYSNFYNYIKKFKISNNLLHFLFPNICAVCDRNIDKDAIFCTHHYAKIKFISSSSSCKICSRELSESEIIGTICLKCVNNKPYFDTSIILFQYEDTIAKLILNLKYNDETYFVDNVCNMITSKLSNIYKINDFIICPVPLSSSRIKARRFNQSSLLAKKIAKKLQLFLIKDLLIRTSFQSTQESLNYQQRVDNVKDSFQLNPKYKNLIKDKKIILVDDVVSSGATANYCSRALKTRASYVVLTAIARSNLNYKRL